MIESRDDPLSLENGKNGTRDGQRKDVERVASSLASQRNDLEQRRFLFRFYTVVAAAAAVRYCSGPSCLFPVALLVSFIPVSCSIFLWNLCRLVMLGSTTAVGGNPGQASVN